MTLSLAACEHASHHAAAPTFSPSPSVETTEMSSTSTEPVDPPPAKPKPAATKIVDKKAEQLQAEPQYESRRFMTRAGPKWVGPMTRGGVKWQTKEEKPRVVREPVHATEPSRAEVEESEETAREIK